MKKRKIKGFTDGVISAVCYGCNPLFFLPMLKMGMGVNSALFYRYLFAVLIYGLWLKIFKKISFALSKKEIFCLFVLGTVFALSSLTLFKSFKYIASGVACTILFIYPIIVALISAFFFKEKINKTTIFAMLAAFFGIFLLNGGQNARLNPEGVSLVLLSAFIYAAYIILVRNLKPVKHIKYDKLSFFVMFFALIAFIVSLKFCTQLQPIFNWKILACSLGLAIFPTIISIETINVAIRLIGPALTAVLGALEPLAAILFGVLIFNEVLNFKMVLGIFLILFGVILIILKDCAPQKRFCNSGFCK